MLLALSPSRTALGEVVIDAIENEFLPNLKNELAREDDEGKRRKLEDLIELWEKYGDRRGKGKVWAEDGLKVLSSLANQLTESEKEDLASDVTAMFYTRPSLRKPILDHDPKDGIDALRKTFKLKVRGAVLDILRTQFKKMRQERLDVDPEEGGIGIQPEAGPSEEEWELEAAKIREVKRAMSSWVMRKLKKKEQQLLFKMWMSIAEKEGPDVNWSRDIYPAWQDMTGKSTSSGEAYKGVIMQLVVDWLEDVYKQPMSKRQKRKLKVSEMVFDRFWMPRFAAWMLEVYHGRRSMLARV
jgi:hypothetical protein